jgi:HEAT repeat protein
MKWNFLITACLLAAIAVVALLIHALREPEPVYQGKRLSEWLPELDVGAWPRRGSIAPADEAIRNIGTNAFPRILQLLRAHSLPPKAALVAFLNRQQIKRIHITTDDERHHRAIAACYALGLDAKRLVPAVAQALSRMAPASQAFASQWLGSLGSQGKAATPALIKMLQDTNDPVRCFAAQNLAHICGERRDEVVVVLKACVRDADQTVRMECTRALEFLGEVPPEWQTADNESLRQKAELGNAEAQVQLAKRLSELRPRLSTNYVEAYEWAAIAASHDNQTAKYLARELELFLTAREKAVAKQAARAFVEGRKRTGIE